ncbi:MAG: hypothetical protein MJZ67_05305 [Bacteroidales bacterium]|nr:hypothetical protein [Bacteroidales bacterium]
MKLTGILDNSLNGQLCIRGFANIKELANISKADYSYQRGLLDRSDISDFLETQTYLFFPEVILSYKIKYALKGKPGEDEPLIKLANGKNYKSNLKNDSTKIDLKKVTFSKGSSKEVTIAELTLDESQGKQLHRIDGNHRLNSAEESSNEKVKRMVIPFCLLLGTEYYDMNEMKVKDNHDEKNFDKATKVFFHNINTKTIPLTSEENLRVMIDDSDNFPNEELFDIFEGEYPIYTRKMISSVNPSIFSNLKRVIDDNYRTFYNEVFKRIAIQKEISDSTVDKIIESMQALNTLYNETPVLLTHKSIGLLISFLWYHLQGTERFCGFKNWILNNHIFEVSDDVSAESLISLYDKISSQEIKVFVAMPFFKGNPDIVADYNSIYDNTIKNIAKKYNVNIELFPIMCAKGGTQDQIQDIINKIKKAKIVFADISENNANVSYEMGWARALEDKQVILVKKSGSENPKSDYQNDTYHEYDDNCRSTSLSKVIEDNILEILEKNYGLIKRKE